jgi:hypothetical protein
MRANYQISQMEVSEGIEEERIETMEEFLVRMRQYYGDGRDQEQISEGSVFVDQLEVNNQTIQNVVIVERESLEESENIRSFGNQMRQNYQIVEVRTERTEEFLDRMRQYYGDSRHQEQGHVTVDQGNQNCDIVRPTQNEVLYELFVSQNMESMDVAVPRLNAQEDFDVAHLDLNLEQLTELEFQNEFSRPIVYTELDIVS